MMSGHSHPRGATRNTVVVTTTTVLTAATVTMAVALRYLRRRARMRARTSVDRVEASLPEDKPLIDIESLAVRQRVIHAACKRASRWMTLSREDATPLAGQVGGASVHRRPLLSLEPDYVLKPLLGDHRGIREIAFYECLAMTASAKDGVREYRNFIKSGAGGGTGTTDITTTTMMTSSPQSTSSFSSLWQRMGDAIDTLAVLGALSCHDAVVTDLEGRLERARVAVRSRLRREAELLAKLGNFTPAYYGVWGQTEYEPAEPYGVDGDGGNAHLLLHDITRNYVRPCVVDLKLGTQTYEPDAPLAKRDRESTKYPAQTAVGFRIVGMRVYHPAHPRADATTGFVLYDKAHGRSLDSTEAVKEALRTFFTIPTTAQEEKQQEGKTNETATANNDDDRADNNVSADVEDATAGNEPASTAATTTTPEPQLRTRAIASLLLQIRSIRRWFEENDCFRFYASSLLIVYEGDRTASDVTACKMIDFGRVRRHAGGDLGYQHGLRNLKHMLADLLDEEEERLATSGGGNAAGAGGGGGQQ